MPWESGPAGRKHIDILPAPRPSSYWWASVSMPRKVPSSSSESPTELLYWREAASSSFASQWCVTLCLPASDTPCSASHRTATPRASRRQLASAGRMCPSAWSSQLSWGWSPWSRHSCRRRASRSHEVSNHSTRPPSLEMACPLGVEASHAAPLCWFRALLRCKHACVSLTIGLPLLEVGCLRGLLEEGVLTLLQDLLGVGHFKF